MKIGHLTGFGSTYDIQQQQGILSEKHLSRSMKTSNKGHQQYKMKYQDFEVIKTIGYGAYGKVEMVRLNGKTYALKAVSKSKLAKEGKEYMAFVQKQMLVILKNVGIIKLYTCFQDRRNIYYVLQHCERGNLKQLISGHFEEITQEMRKLYIAQIVKIIEYFQSIKVVHRDLKPQNILIASNKHLKVNDFGTMEFENCQLVSDKFKEQVSKQKNSVGYLQPSAIMEKKQEEESEKQEIQRTKSHDSTSSNQNSEIDFLNIPLVNKRRKATFVGTCNYVSPELIELSECGFASDIWALGCIIYELYYGRPPFDDDNEYLIFEKIKQGNIEFPDNKKLNDSAKDLIVKLLKKNPEERLGCNSKEGLMISDLLKHQYFSGLQMESLNPLDYEIPDLKQNSEQASDKNNAFSKSKTAESLMSEFIKDHNEHKQNIIFQGIVEKRTFITYNKYYLALMKNLTFFRIKIEEPEQQRTINLKKNMPLYTEPAQLLEPTIFSLMSEEKTYKFRTPEAAKWVEVINNQYMGVASEQIAKRNQEIEAPKSISYNKQIKQTGPQSVIEGSEPSIKIQEQIQSE